MFDERLAAAGRRFGAQQVVAVLCTHGTFAGNDPLGGLTELARWAPLWSERLRIVSKGCFDAVVGDLGNYTSAYCRHMQKGLSRGAGYLVPVSQFHWSGQNHHLARADAAVRLIDRLAETAANLPSSAWRARSGPRVLLWGHSHGGNAFSLLTQLLGVDATARDAFFEATRTFFQRRKSTHIDFPVWERTRQVLAAPDHPLRRLQIDIATFGVPIRYAWHCGGYSKLIHFIHHRPSRRRPEYLAPSPFRLWCALWDAPGDYVQQIGIAGTNFPPVPLAWRTFVADRRLHALLEEELPHESRIARWSRRMRVPESGTTLLVDYRDRLRGPITGLVGHGVYTRTRWLAWHCAQIAEAFYT